MMAPIIGLDLGQASDPSALVVVQEHGFTNEDERIYAVPALHRWELNTRYKTVVKDVVRWCYLLGPNEKFPNRPKPALVIDYTGPGRPIFEDFVDAFMQPEFPELDEEQQAKMDAADLGIPAPGGKVLAGVSALVGITITRGHAVTMVTGSDWHVAKINLAAVVQRVLGTRLRVQVTADKQHLKEQLEHELTNFKIKRKALNGDETYEAWRESDHDDIVLALAVAIWWAENQKPNDSTFIGIEQRVAAQFDEEVRYPNVRFFRPHKNFQPVPLVRGIEVLGCVGFDTPEEAALFVLLMAKATRERPPFEEAERMKRDLDSDKRARIAAAVQKMLEQRPHLLRAGG
jgi:hypothetical protein